MASKRAPLQQIPNGVNSPFRGNVNAAGGKRTRTQAGDPREVVYGQPPAKKQIIEIPDDDVENVDPRKRDGVPAVAYEKLDEPFSRRTNNVQPTAFERKLASVREKKPAPPRQQSEKPPKVSEDNIESVRLWRRHYKKQFPHFVFYFDSVPEETRLKIISQFRVLGSREEKFFSKAVTHVLTTRPIPPELTSTSPDDDAKYNDAQPQTIQPSALTQNQQRTTSLLDANLQRRTQSQTVHVAHDLDPRKAHAANVDILSRARGLNIKIWALEKIQRMLKTMWEPVPGEEMPEAAARERTADDNVVIAKPSKNADLEQLLRNEKINGPADRDMTVAAQDMVSFKGYYLYVHDMDEKTKPVMVRDYPKPPTKEQGKWPQFRLTPSGRCPFIEDPAHTKKLREQGAQAAKAEEELAAQRRTRGTSTQQPAPRQLAEVPANLRRSPRKAVQQANAPLAKPLDPPKTLPHKRQTSTESMPPMFDSTAQTMRSLPRLIHGEPVASGLQQSNVTSAIRSQAITSAAISSSAAVGNKRVGDSKEVSALKRKVLERGANVTSNHSMPSSYMNNVRAAINDDANPPPRAAKRKAQETLGVLHEDEEDTTDHPRPTHRRPPAPKKRKPVQREPKPGYCENCRKKFDDFDEVRST